MTEVQITTSAALFCNSNPEQTVSLGWFEKVVELFHEHELSPILFAAGGGGFELDDCHVLGDPGDDLMKWGEVLRARRQDLVKAVQDGAIYYLGLDSPRADAADRSDARARVSASAWRGQLYVGVDRELASDSVALIRWACNAAKPPFDVRYGITYEMPLSEAPANYATGSGRFTFADFRQELHDRRSGIRRAATADELWTDELNGKRRHLNGLFRGAYPASVLSESHVRAADLTSQSLGRLSELGNSLWLWELSEDEIPPAEAMLEERQLLVRQAHQQ